MAVNPSSSVPVTPCTPRPANGIGRCAPEDFMTHLAMWEAAAPDSGWPETEWGEHVADDEYRAAAEA